MKYKDLEDVLSAFLHYITTAKLYEGMPQISLDSMELFSDKQIRAISRAYKSNMKIEDHILSDVLIAFFTSCRELDENDSKAAERAKMVAEVSDVICQTVNDMPFNNTAYEIERIKAYMAVASSDYEAYRRLRAIDDLYLGKLGVNEKFYAYSNLASFDWNNEIIRDILGDLVKEDKETTYKPDYVCKIIDNIALIAEVKNPQYATTLLDFLKHEIDHNGFTLTETMIWLYNHYPDGAEMYTAFLNKIKGSDLDKEMVNKIFDIPTGGFAVNRRRLLEPYIELPNHVCPEFCRFQQTLGMLISQTDIENGLQWNRNAADIFKLLDEKSTREKDFVHKSLLASQLYGSIAQNYVTRFYTAALSEGNKLSSYIDNRFYCTIGSIMKKLIEFLPYPNGSDSTMNTCCEIIKKICSIDSNDNRLINEILKNIDLLLNNENLGSILGPNDIKRVVDIMVGAKSISAILPIKDVVTKSSVFTEKPRDEEMVENTFRILEIMSSIDPAEDTSDSKTSSFSLGHLKIDCIKELLYNITCNYSYQEAYDIAKKVSELKSKKACLTASMLIKYSDIIVPDLMKNMIELADSNDSYLPFDYAKEAIGSDSVSFVPSEDRGFIKYNGNLFDLLGYLSEKGHLYADNAKDMLDLIKSCGAGLSSGFDTSTDSVEVMLGIKVNKSRDRNKRFFKS